MWISCIDDLKRKSYINLDKVSSIFYSEGKTMITFEDGSIVLVDGDITSQIKIITEAKVLHEGV